MKAHRMFWAFLSVVAALTAAEKTTSAPGSGAAQVVPFERLQSLLPEMTGWTRATPRGETVRRGTPMSRVQADYDKGESTLSFELMDLGGSKEMLAEARAQTKPGLSEKRGEGYTKAITLRDLPGVEEWTPE